MAERNQNPGKSPVWDPTAPVGSGDLAGELTRAVRPGYKARREALLKDLEQPGWVVISHNGQVIWSPVGRTEDSSEAKAGEREVGPK